MFKGNPGASSLVFGPLEREAGLITPELLIPADERDLEDLLLDFEEDLKALHSVQCSPSPGEKEARTASAAVPTMDSEAGNDTWLHFKAKSVPRLHLLSVPPHGLELVSVDKQDFCGRETSDSG